MTLPIENITSLIPQKYPFVMVDKLLYIDETSARSSFYIKGDNVFVKNGFFTEGGLLENMAQTAALKAGYNSDAANKPINSGYIGSVRNLEIFSLPRVNHELLTEMVIENQVFDVIVFQGKVWHNDKLLAQCEMKVFPGIRKKN